MIKSLADQMNDPAYCNYCRKQTETHEWDCKICGHSKPYPEIYLEQIELSVQAQGKFGSHGKVRMVHKPTQIEVSGTASYREQRTLKNNLMRELKRRVEIHNQRRLNETMV